MLQELFVVRCGSGEPDKLWNFPLQIDLCVHFNSSFSFPCVWFLSNAAQNVFKQRYGAGIDDFQPVFPCVRQSAVRGNRMKFLINE
jgi:hypothetical protein